MHVATVYKQVLAPNVYIAQGIDLSGHKDVTEIALDDVVQYFPLCNDFGPVRLCELGWFYRVLCNAQKNEPDKKIVVKVDPGDKRGFTNAVFLLGAYIMLCHETSAEHVCQIFSWVDHIVAEPFRDASNTKADFGLTLSCCWRALERAMALGWVRKPVNGCWGEYDLEEYEHYDNPMNGDLHVVVPGKFVALRGPRDLDGLEYRDDPQGYREFSAEYYIDVFHALDVRAVVRLNENDYDGSVFTRNGIDFHHLEFKDCTPPPKAIVSEFLRIAETSPGLIAVHCKAGLGRTGTLIALHLMRSYGFTARAAIAWLRIVRPGCVIGAQQHYLCCVEQVVAESPVTVSRDPTAKVPPIPPAPSDGRGRGGAAAAATSPACADRPAHRPAESESSSSEQRGRGPAPAAVPVAVPMAFSLTRSQSHPSLREFAEHFDVSDPLTPTHDLSVHEDEAASVQSMVQEALRSASYADASRNIIDETARLLFGSEPDAEALQRVAVRKSSFSERNAARVKVELTSAEGARAAPTPGHPLAAFVLSRSQSDPSHRDPTARDGGGSPPPEEIAADVQAGMRVQATARVQGAMARTALLSSESDGPAAGRRRLSMA